MQENQGCPECPKCNYINSLEKVTKASPAIKNNQRTQAGYYDQNDGAIIERHFTSLPEGFANQIASLFNAPRLQEVAGVCMLVHRWLSEQFSKVKGVPENIRLCSNPLSILFYHKGQPKRLTTKQTEQLHKPMEKTALRIGTMHKINHLLKKQFGIELAYGCSCCAFVTDNLPAVLESSYYNQREKLGRLFDSDVQTTSGNLMYAGNVSEVPEWILNRSAEFGPAEVQSYMLLDTALTACVNENPVDVSEILEAGTKEAEKFLI